MTDAGWVEITAGPTKIKAQARGLGDRANFFKRPPEQHKKQ
jgi:hypothetical protein